MLIAAATTTAITTATTAGTTTTAASGASRFVFPIILLALGAVWLIFIRPQRQKQKLARNKVSELSVGDEVLTAGGMYGKVTRIDDDEVGVEIAPNVEIRLARRAIAAQLTDHSAAGTDGSDDASDEHWQSAFDSESSEEKPG